MAGRNLYVPERDASVECGHDERRARHVRIHVPERGSPTDRLDPAMCGATVEALAVALSQDRSFAPFADGDVDRACRAWNKRMVAGLRPFPRILNGSVPALEAEILDVGLACLGDAKPIEAKEYSRGMVAFEAFGGGHSVQLAHSTQRRVAGRATSRSNPIWQPHSSQAPNSASSKSASVDRSAAASRTAWVCKALTCARSNAIVVPSGSCSSSVFDISAAATMSSNCRASDAACSSARPSSATSAERIARRSISVSPRIHHAYTRK